AAAFVLLLAAANVSTLLVARSLERRRELAIRRALGGSNVSLGLQFLGETLPICFLSGLVAIAAAYASVGVIRGSIPANITKWVAGWSGMVVDARSLAFAFLSAATVAVVLAAAVALAAGRGDMSSALRDASAGSGVGRKRLLWLDGLVA